MTKPLKLTNRKLFVFLVIVITAASIFIAPKPLVINDKATAIANLGQILDPNFYFFRNHPRERLGVVETQFISPLLLPFFFIGLGNISSLLLFLYVVPALLFVFFFPIVSSPPLSLLPFFILLICLGFLKTIKFLFNV